MALTVVLADDAALLRAGVGRLLGNAGMTVVGEAGDAEDLLILVKEHRPDLAVVDIRMPPSFSTEGLDAAIRLRQEYPGTGVLLLSQHVESGSAIELLLGAGRDRPGSVGYLLKERVADVEDFLSALRRVAEGETVLDPTVVEQLMGRPHRGSRPVDELTPRETEVLALMAEGQSNRGIGERLYLSERSVEAVISRIFSKLGLLEAGSSSNRRVLAVLEYLRGPQP